jgi:hypothetical protein
MNFWTPKTDYPNQFILSTSIAGVSMESGILSGDVLALAFETAEKGKSFVSIHAIAEIYDDYSEDNLFTSEDKDEIEKYANSNMETYVVAYVDGRFRSMVEISSCLEDD